MAKSPTCLYKAGPKTLSVQHLAKNPTCLYNTWPKPYMSVQGRTKTLSVSHLSIQHLTKNPVYTRHAQNPCKSVQHLAKTLHVCTWYV